MTKESFPTGVEETPGNSTNEFVEAMQGEDVPAFNPEGAESKEQKELEEMRSKLIEKYTLDAIGGADEIRSIANNAPLNGRTRKSQQKEFVVSRCITSFVGNSTPERPFIAVDRIKDNGEKYTVTEPHDCYKPFFAQAAYRAGLVSIAKTEAGIKNAIDPDTGETDGIFGVELVDITKLSPRQIRMIQIGTHEMRKSLEETVEKNIERLAPDLKD